MRGFNLLFKPLIKFGITGLLPFLLVACTMEMAPATKESKTRFPLSIDVQSLRTSPEQGRVIINADQLETGDIILSRASSAVSLGIRAFTASSVSHASVYIGNNQVAEAIGTGIQIISLQEALDHSAMLAAYRYPKLSDEGRKKIVEFAKLHDGKRYNFLGIVLIAPYTITRNVCRLPTLDAGQRNQCLNNLASVQIGNGSGNAQSFFCSQFVIEAFNYAGHSITDANAAWMSPDDLMHMREGDIKSVAVTDELLYIGHLKEEERPENGEGESLFPHSFISN